MPAIAQKAIALGGKGVVLSYADKPENFYRRLKAGEDRENALASTQKDFRSHQVPGWRHPSVWPAIQLSGNWRPINFN